jgi:hypothetical protein
MEGPVTIPYARIVTTAMYLGEQGTNACPPVEHECWLKRDLEPYLNILDPVDAECPECWMLYLLQGV